MFSFAGKIQDVFFPPKHNPGKGHGLVTPWKSWVSVTEAWNNTFVLAKSKEKEEGGRTSHWLEQPLRVNELNDTGQTAALIIVLH